MPPHITPPLPPHGNERSASGETTSPAGSSPQRAAQDLGLLLTPRVKKKFQGTLIGFVGFLLSPLSWWNDLLINVPLAIMFGWLVSLFYEPAFLAASVVGYWLTNVVGLIMVRYGAQTALQDTPRVFSKKGLIVDGIISLAYTLIIAALVKFKVVQSIASYFSLFVASLLALGALTPMAQAASPPLPALQLPPGFRMTLYAGNNFAPNITSMALDATGRIVVSGPGYIKTLLDNPANGAVGDAILYAETRTGGQGMCFDGPNLMFVGDGGLWRYQDADGDGRADGPPQLLLNLTNSGNGGHAIRKGPDGSWYLLAGDGVRFNDQQASMISSPIRRPEGGAVLRLPRDGSRFEFFAQGFHDPQGLDFNRQGALFVCDRAVSETAGLPWERPARLYETRFAGHHGWRVGEGQRKWDQPGHWVDKVDAWTDFNHGLPSGLVAYRHFQFPERYWNGFFVLDWLNGQIVFLPAKPDGTGDPGAPEVFLQSVGHSGFTPTSAAVGPDGSLWVATGGKQTPGGVWRIQYGTGGYQTGPQSFAPAPTLPPLQNILRAPQPLDAWSMSQWASSAAEFDPHEFGVVIANELGESMPRERAIEVVTALFQGLSTREAQVAAKSRFPAVRERVAWSLGHMPCEDFAPVLIALAGDSNIRVRRAAFDALLQTFPSLSDIDFVPLLLLNLESPDKDVRQTAARIASFLPDAPWNRLMAGTTNSRPALRLGSALARVWREPYSTLQTNLLAQALGAFSANTTPELKLDAVRLMILALGDCAAEGSRPTIYTGCELQISAESIREWAPRITSALHPQFPTADATLNLEIARLLAMLDDADPIVLNKTIARITVASDPATDFQYLVMISRLRARRAPDATERIAAALLQMDFKFAQLKQQPGEQWTPCFIELAKVLMQRDPALGVALLRQPNFARPRHLDLIPLLPADFQPGATALFIRSAEHASDFAWTPEFIEKLALLPPAQTRPVLRKLSANLDLHAQIVLALAKEPEASDRELFLTGLNSANTPAVEASLSALLRIPRDETPEHLVPIYRLLRRLLNEPTAQPLRSQVLALLEKQTGRPQNITEPEGGSQSIRQIYQPVFEAFAQNQPTLAAQTFTEADATVARWNRLLNVAPWNRGGAARGAAIFNERRCNTCHFPQSTIAPSLINIAAYRPPEEVLNRVIYPDRHPAGAWQTTEFVLRDGRSYAGRVAHHEGQVWLVHTGPGITQRFFDAEIVSHQPSRRSLMPIGLLDGLLAPDLANLYGYLKTLQAE